MHLAQINIGRLVAPLDDPRIAGFRNNIERVNGAAKRMPGFVWMLEGASPDCGATDNPLSDDGRTIINMSVWTSVESLSRFVWDTVHRRIYERKAEWFEIMAEQHMCLWWIEEGHRPTVEEGLSRLSHYRQHGDTELAFGWPKTAPPKRCGPGLHPQTAD